MARSGLRSGKPPLAASQINAHLDSKSMSLSSPPAVPFSMHMRWHDLLFMHWPAPIEKLRPLIPPWLKVDTFNGQAWIAVVPFRMTGVRPRNLPAFPRLGAFAELNVRTYVTGPDGEKPGVWFFSLDAAEPIAVRAARW